MSRLSLAAFLFALAALAVGVAGPAIDSNALKSQLDFAANAVGEPRETRETADPSLRQEATRWIARKLRERNDRKEAETRPEPVEGPLGIYAGYVTPVTVVLAIIGLGLALTDWLRTGVSRANVTAGVMACGAVVLPFAWSAIAAALALAAVLAAFAIVGSILG